MNYRNIKSVNSERFSHDITEKLNNIPDSCTFEQKGKHYNYVMGDVLKEHVPLKSRTIKIVPDATWFDAEYEN